MLRADLMPHHSLVFDRDTGKPKGYGFCEFEGGLDEQRWRPQSLLTMYTQTPRRQHQPFAILTTRMWEGDQ